jgi:hypothetical protein
MVHEIEIRREVAHRLDATFKVLSAKIGKHGSATHLANVLGAMSLALTGSPHWPEVVEYAGKLAAALRNENLNEWRNLVSDAKPFLEEATHLSSRLGVLKGHLLEHTLWVTQADSAEHVAQIAQYACLLAYTEPYHEMRRADGLRMANRNVSLRSQSGRD